MIWNEFFISLCYRVATYLESSFSLDVTICSQIHRNKHADASIRKVLMSATHGRSSGGTSRLLRLFSVSPRPKYLNPA